MFRIHLRSAIKHTKHNAHQWHWLLTTSSNLDGTPPASRDRNFTVHITRPVLEGSTHRAGALAPLHCTLL
jgi:hypothetical protein